MAFRERVDKQLDYLRWDVVLDLSAVATVPNHLWTFREFFLRDDVSKSSHGGCVEEEVGWSPRPFPIPAVRGSEKR